jgi:hypothetical protein
MNTPTLAPVYDDWSRLCYNVRVRDKTIYLWGSAGIKDMPFSKPLLLHIRNDLFGEPVTVSTQASGTRTTVGTLQPGECVSIPIQDMSGVFATCKGESTVSCRIKESP